MTTQTAIVLVAALVVSALGVATYPLLKRYAMRAPDAAGFATPAHRDLRLHHEGSVERGRQLDVGCGSEHAHRDRDADCG